MDKENWIVDPQWEAHRRELLSQKVDLKEYTYSYYSELRTSVIFSAINLAIAAIVGLVIANYLGSHVLKIEGILIAALVLYGIFRWIKAAWNSVSEKYDRMKYWRNCYYSVTVKKSVWDQGVFSLQQGDKWGYVDACGREVIPAIYEEVGSFANGIAKVKKGGKWGTINLKGEEVIPVIYEEFSGYYEDLNLIKRDGKFGFIDKKGNEVIAPIYDHADYFRNGVSRVYLNGKYGFIDTTGKEIIPIKYDNIDYYISDGIKIRLNEKDGLIDKNGREIIPPTYDNIAHSIGSLAKVTQNDKLGIIDRNTGRIIVPILFDNIEYDDNRLPFEGYFHVKLNNKWGYYDKNGYEVIPVIYDKVEKFKEGTALVVLDGKYIRIEEPRIK